MRIEITEAERAIMDSLWNQHPLRTGQIVEYVNRDRDWHQKTVSTLIRRLVDKDAVGFEKGVGGYLYSPLIAKEDYRLGEARKMITELFDGEITPLLAGFANAQELSESDLAELRKLVAKLEK
jgi:BlaI family penicillinase repressor